MLASFKQNAAASSSSLNQPSSRIPSSATPLPPSQQKQTRKRRNPDNAKVQSTPSFPHMHSHVRKNKVGFELSFLVIGAQKSGTSWLHTLLQKCNRIALPREQKEVHFWDWHHRKGFDWYTRQFAFPQRLAHTADSSLKSDDPCYGEITPCYIVLPPPTIAEIHKCFPALKIVFVARDLVDRAWSAMRMELRDQTMGLNPGDFAKGVIAGDKQGSKRAKTNEATMSVAQQRRLQQQSNPSAQSDSYYLDRLRSETHTSRSDYATHLKHWLTHFPSENILIVDYRDIEINPRDVLTKVVMHIGLEEKDANEYVEQLSDEDVQQRVNAATDTESNIVGSKTMQKTTTASQHTLSQRPHLKKQMEQYLRPYASKFNLMLKKEGYSWKLNEYTGDVSPA